VLKAKRNPAEIITFYYPNILTRCSTNNILDHSGHNTKIMILHGRTDPFVKKGQIENYVYEMPLWRKEDISLE
jgi:hypothetical protein